MSQCWATKINAAIGKTVGAIMALGAVLLEAKAALPHGAFGKMFSDHPENRGKAPPVRMTIKKADKLMTVVQHPVLSNCSIWSNLPPSWTTLYALSRLPVPFLEEALSAGMVHPGLDGVGAGVLDAVVRQRDEGGNDDLASVLQLIQSWQRLSERLIAKCSGYKVERGENVPVIPEYLLLRIKSTVDAMASAVAGYESRV